MKNYINKLIIMYELYETLYRIYEYILYAYICFCTVSAYTINCIQ